MPTMKILHSLVSSVRPANSVLARRLAFPLLLLGAALALVQPCAGQSGTWTETGDLITRRWDHTATLLPDGMVLVAGGVGEHVTALTSAELYDPAGGSWTATGSLATGRQSHTATLLPNGMMLVAGGSDHEVSLTSAELYDPASGLWSLTGSMAAARESHTATLLPNGQVLVAGGEFDRCCNALAGAELYDPATGTWTATASLAQARRSHTATLLPDGQVLVAGGIKLDDILASAELYDPASGTWTETGSLAHARQVHTATLLPNGKVLVAGGQDSSFNVLTSAELYDPASGTWTETGSLANGRWTHTATLLPNGKVLVAGGGTYIAIASAELYDPASGTWTEAGDLVNARFVHTATLLPNGKVLAAAGLDGSFPPIPTASAELYTSDGGGELTLESSFSRKTDRHNSFDVLLPGVEDRSDNKRFVIGFTFNNEVTGADSASTSCGTIGSVSVDPADSHTLLVTFNGQTCNQQEVTLTLTNVHDTLGNTLASAQTSGCFLIGDLNGDGHVGNGDIGNIQGHLGEITDDTNFRDDINADGRINNQDVQAARSHRGESCP
jgi:WD40 repeat protein